MDGKVRDLEKEAPKAGYEKLGEHDPFAHDCDYIDGDMDDYKPAEKVEHNEDAY